MRKAIACLLVLLMTVGDVAAALADVPTPQPPPAPGPAAVAGQPASPMPIGFDDLFRFHARSVEAGGSLVLGFQDVAIPARGMPMEVTRTYRSDLDRDTGLGPGWGWSFGVQLSADAVTGTPEIVEASGRLTRYEWEAEDRASAVSGRLDTMLVRRGAEVARLFADGSRETFDRAGRLTERWGDGGLAQRISYRDGLPVDVVDAAGRRLEFTYADGRLASVTDPLGRVTRYRHDTGGRLAEVEDPLGRITRYGYADGRLARLDLADGRAVAATYGADGSIAALAGPGDLATRFRHERSFDDSHLGLTMIDGLGHTSSVVWDRHDGDTADPYIAVAITNGLGERTEVELRPGRATVMSPGLPPVTVTLDSIGRPTQLMLADGTVEPVPADIPSPADSQVLEYDRFGYSLVEVRAGATYRLEHDAAGRLTATVDSAGHRATARFDGGDRLLTRTDFLGLASGTLYDPADRMLESTDPRGNVTRATYDAAGFLATIAVPGERTFQFRHDAIGRLVELTDGQIGDTYAYDAADRMTARTDQGGQSERFLYDAAGRMIAHIDTHGRRTELEPDLLGIATAIPVAMGETWQMRHIAGGVETIDAAGIVDRITASPDGLHRAVIAPSGRQANEEYDAAGRLIRRQMPGETAEVWAYDGRGLLVAAGMAGRETRYSYDDDGRLAVEERPDGQVLRYERDAYGRVSRRSDNRGDDTRFAYDSFGDLAASFDARGVRSGYEWDGLGRVIRSGDGSRSIAYSYDERGRLTGQRQEGGLAVGLAYDGLDQLVSRTETAGAISRVWHYRYDAYGAVDEIAFPDGSVQTFEHDADGRVTGMTDRGVSLAVSYDAAGNLTGIARADATASAAYDADGRLAEQNGPAPRRFGYGAGSWPERVEDGRGGVWQQTYDAHGAMSSVTDRLGAVTRFERDAAGRLVAAIDHTGRGQAVERDDAGRVIGDRILDGPGQSYRYDAFGALAAVVRADGRVIGYRRDERGRVTAITADGAPVRAFGYDDAGRIVTATDEVGTHRFIYDEAGNVVSSTDAFGHTLERRLDGLGRPVELISDAGQERYHYGADGLIDRVVGVDGGETAIGRDALRRVDKIAYPGGLTAAIGYDDSDRPSELVYQESAGGVLADRRYQRDAEGDVVAITAGDAVTRYGRDAESRVTGVTAPDGSSADYGYDPAGNPVAFAGIGALAYDQAYRLTAAGGRGTRHDPAGDLTAIEGLVDLVYDPFGRLAAATTPQGGTVRFRYDFLDRLVERNGPGGVVRYQYDGGRPVAAYDGEGRLLTWVERLPDGPGTARLIGGGEARLVMVDALGTPIADRGADGTTHPVAFTAWGAMPQGAPAYADLIGFTGAPTDPTTGIVTLGIRAYLPAIGRFLQPDPAGLGGGSNPYRYADNDPLDNVDRTGRLSIRAFSDGWNSIDHWFELIHRINAGIDIVGATPNGSGNAGRLPGVNTDRWGNPLAVNAEGQNRIPGIWEGTTVRPDPNDPSRVQVCRPCAPEPQGTRQSPNPSIVEGFDTDHFRSTYGHGHVLTNEMGIFDLPGEPPSPQRPNGLPPRRLYQVQAPDGVYEYVVTEDGRLIHSLFKPGAEIDGYVNREGIGQPPREGRRYGERGPVWDRIRDAVERSGQRDFYTGVSRNLQRLAGATNRALPTFSRAGSRIIAALERTQQAFPRLFRAIGWAGLALAAYSTYRDFTDPKVSWGQAFLNLGINAALFALPLLGPAGVALATAIGAALLLAGLLDWLFNNDPTFMTVARGPPRRNSKGQSARGPPFGAEIWLDQPATLAAAVYRDDGKLFRRLGTFDARGGLAATRWDGDGPDGAPAPAGRYILVLAPAAAGAGDTVVRQDVAIERVPPAIQLAVPEIGASQVRQTVTTDKPAVLAFSWRDGAVWRPLGGAQPGKAGSISIGAADVGGNTSVALKVSALDEAGNLAEAETRLDLPAPAADQLVEVTSLDRAVSVEAATTTVAGTDRVPRWLSGTVPGGAEAIGSWRWSADIPDPHGAPAHRSEGAGPDIHYVLAPKERWFLGPQDALVQYLRIDPSAVPRQIAIQLYLENGDGEHRASLGERLIDFGAAGAPGLVDIGPLPAAGEWLRIAIPAPLIGAGGHRVTGVLFATYGGSVAWGGTATADAQSPTASIAPAGETVATANTTVRLDIGYRIAGAAGDLDAALLANGQEWPVATGVGPGPGPRHLFWTGPAAALADAKLRFRAPVAGGGAGEQVVALADLDAAPPLVARIDYPPAGAIGRSDVPIFGQAGGPGFARYVVDVRPAAAPAEAEWQAIVQSAEPAAIDPAGIAATLHHFDHAGLRRPLSGNLATLQTGSVAYSFAFRPGGATLPSGRLILRLRVFGTDGAVAEDRTELIVGEVADDRGPTRVTSPDGNAVLEIPALAMPADVGAIAVEPTEVAGAGSAAVRAYRLLPPGLALRAPARLTLTPTAAGPAAVRLLGGDGGTRPLAADTEAGGGMSVQVDRFPTAGAFAVVPATAPAPPLVLVPAEPIAGPVDLVAQSEPGTRVALQREADAEPVASVVAGAGGLAVLAAVPLAAGDNRFIAVAVDPAGAASTPAPVTITAAAAAPAGGHVRQWLPLPQTVEAGSTLRVAATLDDAPLAVEATVAGGGGDRTLRLVRAGEEHVGVLAVGDAPARLTLTLLGESRSLTVVDTVGPAPPRAWPEGLPAAAWRVDAAEAVAGGALLDHAVPADAASTLGFLYRLRQDPAAMLVLRSDRGTTVLPLAGPEPHVSAPVSVAPAPALAADGGWHFAQMPLAPLLGGPAKRIDRLEFVRSVPVSWNLDTLADPAGVDIRGLWLGPAWPAQGPASVHLAYGGAVAAMEWSVDASLDGPAPQSQPTLVEGSPAELALPALQGTGIFALHLRARDQAGNWGPWSDTPFIIDRDPPQIADPSPAPAELSAEQRARFRVVDAGLGFDPSTLEMSVNGIAVPPEAIRYEPASGLVTVAFGTLPERPQPDATGGFAVEISSAADYAGNRMPEPYRWAWQFDPSSLAGSAAQLVTTAGGSDAAWSPDGGRLAYVSDRDGQPDLYERDLASGTERRLTDDAAAEASPSYTADGRLVFATAAGVTALDPATGATALLASGMADPFAAADGGVLAAEGGRVVRLDPDGGRAATLVALADGITARRPRPTESGIVFGESVYHESIWSAEPGGTPVPLSAGLDDPALLERDPSPDPDGKWIAFATGGGTPGLWLADGRGGGRRLLVDGREGEIRRPAWSPDGRRLVFDSDANGVRNLWLVELGRLPQATVEPAFLSYAGGPARLEMTLAEPASVAISVADGDNHPLQSLRDAAPAQGRLAVDWDGHGADGAPLADGRYQFVAEIAGAGPLLTARFPVAIDNTPPRTTAYRSSDGRAIGPGALAGADDSIVLRASDGPDGAGVRRIAFRRDGEAAWRTFAAPIPVAELEGAGLVFRAEDMLGQAEAPQRLDPSTGETGPAAEPEAAPQPAPAPATPPAQPEPRASSLWLWVWLAALLALGAAGIIVIRRWRR